MRVRPMLTIATFESSLVDSWQGGDISVEGAEGKERRKGGIVFPKGFKREREMIKVREIIFYCVISGYLCF